MYVTLHGMILCGNAKLNNVVSFFFEETCIALNLRLPYTDNNYSHAKNSFWVQLYKKLLTFLLSGN